MGGFSLFELMAVMSILGISLGLVVPKFTQTLVVEQAKTKTVQLMHFLQEAKSIALARNQMLWIDIELDNQNTAQPWQLILHTSATENQPEQVLLTFFGEREFDLNWGYAQNQIFIDGRKGKMANGYLQITPRQSDMPCLKIITSYGAGRLRRCSVGKKVNGFPLC